MNALTNSSIGNGFDTVFSEIDSTKKLNLKNTKLWDYKIFTKKIEQS